MRKNLSFVLVLVLCMNICSVLALAERGSDWTCSTVKSEDEISGYYVKVVNYRGNEEVVTIPETINGYPVREIEDFVYSGDNLCTKEVVIPNSVRTIGEHAFYNCKRLEKVTIPGSVTIICRYAFAFLDNLKEVNLSEGLIEIGDGAFSSCDSLTELYIPKTVKSVGADGNFRSAFDSYFEPTPVKITVDPENEHYMSDENGWVYTKDGKTLLMACNVGKTVEIPEGVTEIKKYVFFGLNEIQEVILPDTLEKIGAVAFGKCENMEKIEFTDSIRYIDKYAFENCCGLTELTFGKNVEYIGNAAFIDCGNLKKVTFLNPETEIARDMPITYWLSGKMRYMGEHSAFHLAGVEVVTCYIGSTAYDYFKGKTIVPIIKVEIDGNIVKTDSIPYIKNGRTMVPMRAIFEALGAEVSWEDTTKTAVGVKDSVEVRITIGENVLYRNGEGIELDCAAEITNNRTMVPVRAISEAFGCSVNWIDETKTVEITN